MTKPDFSTRPRLWGALALLVGATLALSACTSGGAKKDGTQTVVTNANGKTTTVTSGPESSSVPPSKTAPPAKPVHVSLGNVSDGGDVGVGMPVIATFKVKITDAKAFQKATKVTVNGAAAPGAWYFEYSDPASGHVMEGHFRLQNYWPAHAQVHIDMPVKGLSAGRGLAFENSLTLDFATHAANISTVDDSTHMITVTSDNAPYGVFPVSLGAVKTPTTRGTKVIMEKGASICMSGPGYHECGVKFTQRLTYDGEYLHAAPWNCVGAPGCAGPANNIGKADSSNGCTNLLPADAKKLYAFLQIGDVVMYPNASGPKMQFGAGYGGWNVSWPQWQTGGVIPTR